MEVEGECVGSGERDLQDDPNDLEGMPVFVVRFSKLFAKCFRLKLLFENSRNCLSLRGISCMHAKNFVEG